MSPPHVSLKPISFYHFAHRPKPVRIKDARFQHLASANFSGHYPLIAIDAKILARPRSMDIAVAVATVEKQPHAGEQLAYITDDTLHSTPDAPVHIDVATIQTGGDPNADTVTATLDPKTLAHADTLPSDIAPCAKTVDKLLDQLPGDNALADDAKHHLADRDINRSTNNHAPCDTTDSNSDINSDINSHAAYDKDATSINTRNASNDGIDTLADTNANTNTNTDIDTQADGDVRHVTNRTNHNVSAGGVGSKAIGDNKAKEHTQHGKPQPLNQSLADVYASEEELKEQREAKLEAYKKFVAEQESKVDIDYAGIRVNIEANALPSKMYFIMNALSAIIASYGLVIGSPAVVIGAMLVAMMLGPISGVALAIIDYRLPFLRRSLFTVIAGGAMVIAIGFVIGFMHKDTPLSHEILSRTQPTSMDLMIALAGGTAGAYAMISPHLSVAVVGVAVATALVPPLAASGILLAHGQWSLGFGALLLAITNIIAIQFTNAMVLWFSGFRRLLEDDYKTNTHFAFIRRNAVPLLLLAVIGTYLTINLNTIAKKQTYENEVRETISDYFVDKGNVLTAVQFVNKADHQSIRAVIRGKTRPSSGDAQNIEASISKRIDNMYPDLLPVRVQLRYLPIVVIDSNPEYTQDIDETDAAILAKES